jgi:hypothetical protein
MQLERLLPVVHRGVTKLFDAIAEMIDEWPLGDIARTYRRPWARIAQACHDRMSGGDVQYV